jgi:hypothetical protein
MVTCCWSLPTVIPGPPWSSRDRGSLTSLAHPSPKIFRPTVSRGRRIILAKLGRRSDWSSSFKASHSARRCRQPYLFVMLIGSNYTALVLLVWVALPVRYWLRRRSKSALPYPPGPKWYPFIGNVLDFPTSVPSWGGLTSMVQPIWCGLSIPQVARLIPLNPRYRCPLSQSPWDERHGP